MSHTNNLEHLNDLRLTADVLESQIGFTTNAFWVGSLWGGVYRLSVWRQPHHWLRILGTEVMTLALLGMLSVPVGLTTIRDSTSQNTHRFLRVTATATGIMFASWHLYRWHRTRTLRPLLHLLDDIDHYNQLVETAILLDALTQVSHSASAPDPTPILDALQASRLSLVTAIHLERLMRQHQRLIHRHQTLWLELDQALITLQALELQVQAQDHQSVIHQALQISMHVQATVEQLSQP